MQSDLKATGAALLSPSLKKQIQKMHEVDGVTPDEISEIYQIPVLIIENILNPGLASVRQSDIPNGLTVKPNDATSEYEEQLSRVQSIEDQLRDHESAAVETLGELVSTSDSDAIRMHSARTILEIRAGKLRPERPDKRAADGGMTPDAFRAIMEETIRSYNATRERAAKATVIESAVIANQPSVSQSLPVTA